MGSPPRWTLALSVALAFSCGLAAAQLTQAQEIYERTINALFKEDVDVGRPRTVLVLKSSDTLAHLPDLSYRGRSAPTPLAPDWSGGTLRFSCVTRSVISSAIPAPFQRVTSRPARDWLEITTPETSSLVCHQLHSHQTQLRLWSMSLCTAARFAAAVTSCTSEEAFSVAGWSWQPFPFGAVDVVGLLSNKRLKLPGAHK